MLKKMNILFAALLIMSTLGVAGCNTMEGIGQDAKAAGEKLSNMADENKGY